MLRDTSQEKHMNENSMTSKVARDRAASVASAYKADTGASTLAEKVVAFLLYARKEAPGVYFQANVVAKAVLVLSKQPSLESKQADVVRGSVSRARVIMLEKHECSLHVERGRGMRATTGDDDQAKTRVEVAAKRFVSAEGALSREAAIVDPAKIKDETRRRWFKQEVLGSIKLLELDRKIDKLLPPKPEK